MRVEVNAQGEYLLPVQAAGVRFQAVLDTGFTDADGEIGIAVDSDVYAAIEPRLLYRQALPMLVATDEVRLVQSGLSYAQVGDLPRRETRIVETGSNLVGVCYFHSTPEYRLDWDFRTKEISISRKDQSPTQPCAAPQPPSST